ncbi:metallopeptidase family M24 domain-containing protein [Hirsutella rhossiliensis]|uniref:Xaa-Pro aminopeptidase n=1 Tax=Hirsutella rhossiliensis TaxID=111463 RepID=A0A9P8MQR1_9HYPO|nr:metallopeptidase family m24 domain-containing protein [Hirsutella rhossiliensis]KAH0960023.1 metallopeptidase family m24 domain-containing protein [Hirsutella rhossiliensis]
MELGRNVERDLDALSLNVQGRRGEAATATLPIVKYPAKLHARRVAAELDVDNGLVYLAGQPEVNLDDSDQPRPFRQRRYFFYLAGANFAGCHVTYDIAADHLILWVPHVAPKDVLWYGSKPSPQRCMALSDVDDARYAAQLPDYVSRHHAASTVYVLHADQAPPPPHSAHGGAAARCRIDDVRLRPAMDRARVVKTDYEVAMVRRANDVSSAAHRFVAERLLRLDSERDVEALFQAACHLRGTRSQAYAVIAGAGANASTLHYVDNDAPLAGRQLVLLDAGCEWDCYASDVTRTMPLSGSFSPRAAAVHAVVQRMQDECIARVRPGAVYYHLHLHAAAVALAGLLQLGILRGDRDEIARAGTVAAFFPHGLGHHVGLEVHDVDGGFPLLAPPRPHRFVGGKRVAVTPEALVAMAEELKADGGEETSTRGKLRPNMIVTVEPGIYFCRPFLEAAFLADPKHARFIDADVLEGFYPVGGVRIEDCILVTPDGHENLTSAPKGAELLDVINNGGHG